MLQRAQKLRDSEGYNSAEQLSEAGAVMASALIAASAGAADSGKPVKTDSGGLIASSFLLLSPRDNTFTVGIDAGDTDHDLLFSAGRALADAGDVNIIDASSIIKRIDAGFAEGTNQGGLDTGSVQANQLYYCFRIMKTNGTKDALMSLSRTAPTMPQDFTKKRLAGIALTDSSANLYAFEQYYNDFEVMEQVQVLSDATLTDGAFETTPIPVPPRCKFRIGAVVTASAANSSMRINILNANHPDDTNCGRLGTFTSTGTHTCVALGGNGLISVNEDSEIKYSCRETTGTNTLTLRLEAIDLENVRERI